MATRRRKATEKVDGLGPDDKRRLRIAIRRVWSWSHARRLCIARATQDDDFAVCEQCGELVAKVYPDHKTPVGEVSPGFIERMFCPSTELQALCKKCHAYKTREERRRQKAASTLLT